MSRIADLKSLLFLLLISAEGIVGVEHVHAQGTVVVRGVVFDAVDRAPLPGATAQLMMPGDTLVYAGSSANEDGRFEMKNLRAGRYTISVRFVGYASQQFEFALEDGQTRTLNFALEPETIYMPAVVVSVSSVPEKATDAPAAVTVLPAESFEQDIVASPVETLRNVPGLDMARTGIDRREIVIRGFGRTFTGATYVMTDYRQSAVASLGVNAYNMMPISSIDLERVEVVRGPAGAVYGPGVDEGAIHFISKDPFLYPGTTIAVAGGERSLWNAELRHAGVLRGRFGYKISAQYLRAEEWALDGGDPHDSLMIERYYTEIPLETDVTRVVVNGTLAYRFGTQTQLTGVAGYASAKSPFLSDIGPLQSDGFGYQFGQLRFRSGRFFAQAYLNANEAGHSFVYAGPNVASSLSGETVVDRSTQLNLQAQYGLDLAGGAERLTFGADYERTNPATRHTINGRNEESDRIHEYGLYAQSLTRLASQLNLTLSARLDYDNIFETLQVSPRAALVYKPHAQHSVRATYNRAFASPGTNSLFLDIIAAERPLPLRARGAVDGFTFRHNPDFGALAGTDLVAYSLDPRNPGQPQPVGLPLDAVYGAIYDELRKIPIPVLTQVLCDEGLCLEPEMVAYLVNELSPAEGTDVRGFTRGDLRIPDLSGGAAESVSGAPDIDPLKQSSTQTFELGYRGLIHNRVHVNIDAYYTIKKNFVRGLQIETPLVFVPGLRSDLHPAIASGIASNEELLAALGQLNIPPEVAAGLILKLADPQLPSTNTPVALLQPDENNPGSGHIPELMMTYRNFGRVAFFGLETSFDYFLDDRTTLFGSISWASDDYFDHSELGEDNEDLFVSLNAPTLKGGVGASYRAPVGLSFSLGGRYVQGFAVHSGPYSGFVDDYFLLDAGLGYDFGRFAPGLRLDVTVQNILDHNHREFIGAPKMGRLGLARLTYSI